MHFIWHPAQGTSPGQRKLVHLSKKALNTPLQPHSQEIAIGNRLPILYENATPVISVSHTNSPRNAPEKISVVVNSLEPSNDF